MSLKCIKCKHLALNKDKYPCNSCKDYRDLDCMNKMFSHFKDRNSINRRYEEWEQVLR